MLYAIGILLALDLQQLWPSYQFIKHAGTFSYRSMLFASVIFVFVLSVGKNPGSLQSKG